MPKVKEGETRSHYVHRAIDKMVHGEGLTPKQALGKAEGMYDQAHKHKSGSKRK